MGMNSSKIVFQKVCQYVSNIEQKINYIRIFLIHLASFSETDDEMLEKNFSCSSIWKTDESHFKKSARFTEISYEFFSS